MMKFTRASIIFLVPLFGWILALLSPCSAATPGPAWTNVSNGLTGAVPGVSQIVIDHVAGTTFYALTSGGLFKSTDSGSSWTALGSIAGVNVIALDPKSASTVYAGTAHGVVKTTNGGASWFSAGLSDTSVGILAVDPITPSTLYAVGNGLYKSTDRGRSWTQLNLVPPAGSEGVFIAAFVVDPLTPSTLYVALGRGAGSSFFLKSLDGGASWNVIYANGPGPFYETSSNLVIDPSNPSTLYRINPLQKSTDGGVSWIGLTEPKTSGSYGARALAVDPRNSNTLYVALSWNTGQAIYKSMDEGQSWNAVDTIIPLPHTSPSAPTRAPSMPRPPPASSRAPTAD